jgi:hypothetical protein
VKTNHLTESEVWVHYNSIELGASPTFAIRMIGRIVIQLLLDIRDAKETTD